MQVSKKVTITIEILNLDLTEDYLISEIEKLVENLNSDKTNSTHKNVVAQRNKQRIFKAYNLLSTINKGKVKQKEVVEITGLSERTIRKYWKELKQNKLS